MTSPTTQITALAEVGQHLKDLLAQTGAEVGAEVEFLAAAAKSETAMGERIRRTADRLRGLADEFDRAAATYPAGDSQ